MSHLTARGKPCGLKDGHKDHHRSVESVDQKRGWRKEHPDYFADWRKEHPDYFADWRKEHPGYRRKYDQWHHAQYYANTRAEVFNHYGNECAYCGATDILQIDHMDGNGEEHRIEIFGRRGGDFYRWLRKNNFPDGYQTLCRSCNMRKGSLTDAEYRQRFSLTRSPTGSAKLPRTTVSYHKSEQESGSLRHQVALATHTDGPGSVASTVAPGPNPY